MSKQSRKRWQRKKSQVYGTHRWRELRSTVLTPAKLCEVCGHLLATAVHHLRTPFTSAGIDFDLAFDEKNLQAVCFSCHTKIHREERKTRLGKRCGSCDYPLENGRCGFCVAEEKIAVG